MTDAFEPKTCADTHGGIGPVTASGDYRSNRTTSSTGVVSGTMSGEVDWFHPSVPACGPWHAPKSPSSRDREPSTRACRGWRRCARVPPCGIDRSAPPSREQPVRHHHRRRVRRARTGRRRTAAHREPQRRRADHAHQRGNHAAPSAGRGTRRTPRRGRPPRRAGPELRRRAGADGHAGREGWQALEEAVPQGHHRRRPALRHRRQRHGDGHGQGRQRRRGRRQPARPHLLLDRRHRFSRTTGSRSARTTRSARRRTPRSPTAARSCSSAAGW